MDKIDILKKLGERAVELEKLITVKESELAVMEKDLKDLTTLILPEMFDEIGITSVTLSNGKTLEVKKKVTGRVVDEGECYQWLDENGHSAIMKKEYTMSYRAGEDTTEVETLLRQKGIAFTQKLAIHPSTLKKFIKERLEEGDNIPFKPFGIYEYKEVEMTK